MRDCYFDGVDSFNDRICCFLSVGCGEAGWETIEKSAWKFLKDSLAAIATETRKTEQDFHADHGELFADRRAFRFNVQQGMHGVGLEEWQKADQISNAAEEYMVNREVREKTTSAVNVLSRKQCILADFD